MVGISEINKSIIESIIPVVFVISERPLPKIKYNIAVVNPNTIHKYEGIKYMIEFINLKIVKNLILAFWDFPKLLFIAINPSLYYKLYHNPNIVCK